MARIPPEWYRNLWFIESLQRDQPPQQLLAHDEACLIRSTLEKIPWAVHDFVVVCGCQGVQDVLEVLG